MGSALAQGSATRALSALAGEDEQLRGEIARWFFSAVGGESPAEEWATRETLDEGLEILKTLIRDWIARSHADDARMLAADYAAQTGALRRIASADALFVLAKIAQAQRLAATNVTPALVSELVRMAISTAGTRSRRTDALR